MKEIDKQINQISFSLNKETEVLIKHLQDNNDRLINEINNFEMRCIANIDLDKINIAKFNDFLNETKHFHQESIEYLRKYQIQKTEIVKANS